MHLIVGLGNPGAEYAAHRHNIGFLAVDEIARQHSFPPFRQKFSALISEGVIDGEKIMLIKPQTFMNRSGDSVAQAASFYKLTPSDISVVHDELDLAPGKVRVKTGGGNGGHNGLRSIESHLGKDFVRIRLGIGHPGHKDRVHSHVLSNFHKADNEWLEPLLDALAKNAALIAKGDAAGLMNKLALALPTASKSEADKSAPKAQSHVRQARQSAPQSKLPESGPMADMLKKLFGKKN
ncbi:aminoacyl-tRNA hydrolase [Pelagibacterium halotolerans]|uniref:Peptidyl-tRNA hydrolase n=1 Tax=Pelagibacterium halotolerans (strain DSM 22347 / JCM 15775 / CGMCC 1.7692 / B2) TaxID=1082931 RepID=G4R6M7_PELHB|nr:aminoacyl-tRNA hydrolase [Pelagibacterium halotolerans]AEQ52189.1 peptidyl-tRNA hydrolase [Pelagibacterium halotolerans B2]QJR18053.1 aminoacyl-tRNA hydrolase [Pelagibacterium halotolerans]SDZ85358.1 peptidyl-tRNA hydrolase [Pelagibacterium halotolerans]